MSYPPITEKRKTQEENRERERERGMQQSCSTAINQICKPV
jgi:hypothetical protein